jgi:uracil-DNA glycosylase
MNIQSMFRGVGKDWIKIFTSDKLRPHLAKAIDELKKENIKKITPPVNDIFNFARHTPYDKLKVVIIGQDPYPKEGDANGCAFSSDSKTVPSSLKNIYKCLKNKGHINEIPKTSNLTYWARQGVLLLNAALTTQIGKSNIHSEIWKPFTDELIKYISSDMEGLIQFVLWGNEAQKKIPLIDSECPTHTWKHPSPLAQNCDEKDKFINCDSFDKVNEFITDQLEETPIDWNVSPNYLVYTDGACSGNGKGILSKSGYAVYFTKGPFAGNVYYEKLAPTIYKKEIIYGSNIRAEGFAILYAIEKVAELDYDCVLTLVTDSEFWINMIKDYIPSWKNKGIDFETKKNPDLVIKLDNAINKFNEKCILHLIHVKSHQKEQDISQEHIEGNKIADRYAVKAKSLKEMSVIMIEEV